MAAEIIELDDHRPHTQAYMECRPCGHDWVAVFPTQYADPTKLECPNCGALDSIPPDDLLPCDGAD